MVLDRLYTIDGTSSFHRLSGKQFMMSFSCKMELKWTNSSHLLWKGIGVICFGAFFYKSAMRSRYLFWKLRCCKFWAWRPNNFSSLFLTLSINFQHLLLQNLRKNCFKKLKKISMSDETSWLVTLDHVLVSIKHSPYLGSTGKSLTMGLTLFINLTLAFRPYGWTVQSIFIQ